jgi:outer membrane protein OmpA-like peptidoglycan-associated protein
MSKSFWLGLFIVGTLLILAIGVFLIGDRQFLFSATYPLKSDFQNVGGLNVGADVRVGGIRAGTVQAIELPGQSDGRVGVVMRLQSSTRSLIRADSVASIKTEGLLGNKYVEITFGSKAASAIHDADAIRSDAPVDVTESAHALAVQTKSVLGAVQDDLEALKSNFLFRGYFNKRGYEDSAELTRHTIAKLPARAPVRKFDYDSADLFGTSDNAKLRNERSLKEAGTYLEQTKFGLVVIAASEVLGDTDKVRVLTQARAVAIRDYLAEQFRVDDTRIRTIGMGKTSAKGNSGTIQILIYP